MTDYKIIFLGDIGVGKSSLLSRICDRDFNPDSKTTIGTDFMFKTIIYKDKTLSLKFWDTSGEERYNSISQMYYRGAVGAFIVYDITNVDSFEHAKSLIKKAKDMNPKMTCVLVANKSDLSHNRTVLENRGRLLASENSILFTESSAATDNNFEKIWMLLIEKIEKLNNREIKKELIKLGESSKITKSQC